MLKTNYYNKLKTRMLLACLLLISCIACKKEEQYHTFDPTVLIHESYLATLDSTITSLENMLKSKSYDTILLNYKQARNYFKKAEPILSFSNKHNYLAINQPNILKVEEEDATDIKVKQPFGFQVLEEQLLAEALDDAFITNIKASINRLQLVKTNANMKLKKHHILWLIRDQIARIALTGITGFDSPMQRSLVEAHENYNSILSYLLQCEPYFKNKALLDQWKEEIKASQLMLTTTNFNDFDRYHFIKKHSHKQLQLLKETISDWDVTFSVALAFNNDMTSLFSENTFNTAFFSDYHYEAINTSDKITLGKELFNDPLLSSDNTMSCATCHIASKGFADGLKTFPLQNRNTPTVTYAGLQKAFFHDGRAGSLEGQIVGVVENENEFHTDLETLTNNVKKDTSYTKAFKAIGFKTINDMAIRHVIASYVRSLSKFNSKFDDNINGRKNDLTSREINGYNLFSGKALCATCHFAPVFNGTVPPYFNDSEVELIGVPNTKDKTIDSIDSDLGRYYVFKTENRKHFFKTPTLRNIAITGPYMHNGVYETLEEVMEFYNNGGGHGLGFDLEYQTLPTDSLNLSETEIEDIILFMKTLTDASN